MFAGSVRGAERGCPLPALGMPCKTGLRARPPAGFPLASLFSFAPSQYSTQGGWHWAADLGLGLPLPGGNPGKRAETGPRVAEWRRRLPARPLPSSRPLLLPLPGPAQVRPRPAPGAGRGEGARAAIGRAERSAARAWTRSTLPSSRRSATASSSSASGCRRRTAISRRISRRSRMTATTGRCREPQPCVPIAAPQPQNPEPGTGRGVKGSPKRPGPAWALLHYRTLSGRLALGGLGFRPCVAPPSCPDLPCLLPSCRHRSLLLGNRSPHPYTHTHLSFHE